MSDGLLKELEQFYDELPTTVRDDLSFMMVILADENLVVQEVQDVYAVPARRLFTAQTPIGRLGNLINAVSVFDVYFAMNAHRRFDLKRSGRKAATQERAGVSALLDQYADQVDAIEIARRRWTELRRTRLTPVAIAEALAPSNSRIPRRRPTPTVATARPSNPGETHDRAIP